MSSKKVIIMHEIFVGLRIIIIYVLNLNFKAIRRTLFGVKGNFNCIGKWPKLS